jgi:DNA-binding CsgD family transcriptional regulator
MPSSRRVLAGQPVHRLAEQAGMPGMPAVLLDQVADEPAQAGMAAVGPGDVDQLGESAVGQGRSEPGAGPFDGAVPQSVELFGGVAGRGGELPVLVVVPRRGVPRRSGRLTGPAGARTAKERGEAMSLATAAEYALILASPGPQPLASRPDGAQLSARERELVALVALGGTNAEIAAQLYLSVRTVTSHLDRIRDKTGCRRRADVTRLALSEGLV